MGTKTRFQVRLPVKRIGRGCEVDRRPRSPLAAGRISEIEIAQRPCLGPVHAIDLALEDQHVFVLVIEHNGLEPPVERVVRRMSVVE
jgi:hypothetical protein